jgi:hypothetical protein
MVLPWTGIALFINGVLGLVLVLRLLSLRLHRVYQVFFAYVMLVLLTPPVVMVANSMTSLDYRVVYLGVSVASWTLTLSMVYALLGAILGHLPGILRFSRWLLAGVFALSIIIALVLARPEIHIDQNSYAGSYLQLAVKLVSPLERVVTTVSLLALLAIQGFILWFPVSLPRNLVLFSIGFVITFICETILLLVRGLLPASAAAIIDPINLFILAAFLLYFCLVITAAGELIPVRIGHVWQISEQERLFRQLENINGALLRSVRN